MLVFPKNAEKNASTIEKGLPVLYCYNANPNARINIEVMKEMLSRLNEK